MAVDQARERTSATSSVRRELITLDVEPAEIIAPTRTALHFQNANGGDLYILPGLLLVFDGRSDFALLRLTDVQLEYSPLRVLETGEVPADAKSIGQTWAKVNKNGSPDRRFRDNFRIPVVEYGGLTFTSSTGLNEQFMFSSSTKAEVFATAFSHHRSGLPES